MAKRKVTSGTCEYLVLRETGPAAIYTPCGKPAVIRDTKKVKGREPSLFCEEHRDG